MAIDPKIGPLLAAYVRGEPGAVEVLHDAQLERGMDPLPAAEDAATRLENAFPQLSADAQIVVGCAAVRRVLERFTKELPDELSPERALAALEQSRGVVSAEHRQSAFKAWMACQKQKTSPDATRAAWSVWMLVRETPVIALRTARAIDPNELGAQIDLLARALGG